MVDHVLEERGCLGARQDLRRSWTLVLRDEIVRCLQHNRCFTESAMADRLDVRAERLTFHACLWDSYRGSFKEVHFSNPCLILGKSVEAHAKRTSPKV